MSSGSRKRGLGDDSHNVVDIGRKRSKENDQLLSETESFDFVDDVITDLRSIEGYVGQVKSEDFRKVVDKLEKSDILVRKKQGQDEPKHHVIYKEDIMELRMLIDEYCVLTGSGKFEKLIQKIKSDDRLLMRQTNLGEVSKRVSEKVHHQRYEPLQQELHSSQAVEQSAPTIRVEDEVIEMKDIQNLRAGGEGFVASFFETVESPLEFSNQLKNVAQIHFNSLLLVKLNLTPKEINKVAVQNIRDMIEQRTILIQNAQYVYSLIDQQKFIKELLIKLGRLTQLDKYKTLFNMLQSIDLSTCPYNWPFFRYLADFDLVECIANNSDNAAAQHMLRARQLLLLSLTFESKFGVMQLNLNDSKLRDDSAGVSGLDNRKFQYGMEMNEVDAINLFGLLNIIVQFYDISKASITLRSDGSNSKSYYQLLESTFGAPPKKSNGKIRVQEIFVKSPEMLDFLRWFCPTTLTISCDRGELFDVSLISDVDVIELQKINADRLIENSKASKIRLGKKAIWSSKSISRVLTAHRLSADKGPVRVIFCLCHAGTGSLKEWRELFESWSRNFEAEHGKIGRKVKMIDNNTDHVTLALY